MTPYKPPPPPPARLFVMLAREAPVAVILKRGPSRWVQMIKWHTDTDTFEMGQWFRGRVYKRLCDLSPNGQLLIYKAFRFGHESESEYDDNTWTAISKPPYFAPLALWPYGNGGNFINNELAALEGYTIEAHRNYPPQGLRVIFKYDTTEDLRTQIEPKDYVDWKETSRGNDTHSSIVARAFPNKAVERHYRIQPHVFEFFYIDGITGKRYELINATWADFDQQGRLVFAKEGKLFTGTLDNGELKLTELADFNNNKPAPDWAQK